MTLVTETRIPRTDAAKPHTVQVVKACTRCGGDGVWHGWRPGVCFRCGGTGTDPRPETVYAYPRDWDDAQIAEHVEVLAARKRQAQARREAKGEQALAEQLARVPGLREAYDAVTAEREAYNAAVIALEQQYGENSEERWQYAPKEMFNSAFISDLLFKLNTGKVLTENQANAFVKAVNGAKEYAAKTQAQKAAEAESAKPCPSGTLTLEGEVISRKWQESMYGSTLKMLVACDGFKVWGSVPSGVDIEKGDVIRFTANVEASKDDMSFGFFKRPRKVEVIEKGEK